MSRWSRWRRASALVAALLAAPAVRAATPTASPTAAPAPDELVLAVELDGVEQPDAVLVRRAGDSLLVAAADLRRLGFPIPADRTGAVPLDEVPGLQATINAQRQVLVLTGPHGPTQLRLIPPAPIDDTPVSRLWGGYINYEATATRSPAGLGMGASLEAVAFGPSGYAFAGAIARADGGGTAVERTDIGYTLDSPARLVSVTLGDVITAASSQSRPVRLAGMRIGTDFSLRPDLVTFPLPAISGTAAVPTAVDVLVNGAQQASSEIRAGQFTVADIPVQTGVNTIAVATQDALGRAVVQTVTTYASRDLLRPGLVSWSGEAGWIRTGYLTPTDQYRALAVSGTMRAGITDRLTLESHGEASGRLVNAATGASLGLGPFGLLSTAAGLSVAADRQPPGVQLAAGLERVSHPISFSARYLYQSRGWSDLAGRYGATMPGHSLVLNIGFDLQRLGTLGAGLIALGDGVARFDPGGRPLAKPLLTPATTLLNGSYSTRIARRLSLVANVAVDTRRSHSQFASIGLLLLTGSRRNGYAGVQHQAGATGATVSVTQSTLEPGEWGYRVAATAGPVDQASAAVQYLAHSGEVEAAVQIVDGRAAAQLSARGAIGIADGHPFAADTMTGSFAVIRTRGAPDTPVYQDHRRIGTTDGAGVLVAPNLPSFERVTFSIDPAELPMEAALDHATAAVSIPRRSGAAVLFDLRPTRATLITLVDAAGAALPAGARAVIDGKAYPVGIGGLVYAELPPALTRFRVERDPTSGCTATATEPARHIWRVACPPSGRDAVALD